MSFGRFNLCKSCCCYKNLAIISIYDESQPVYTGGSQYGEDLHQWDKFIRSLKVSEVVLGLIVPQQSGIGGIKHPDHPLPEDTIGEILTMELPDQNPRVKAEDIYQMFVDLKGELPINMLVFTLDNSGSILVSAYEEELKKAKRMIRRDFPKVKFLNDLSNSGERWLNDAYQSAWNRTCG